MLQLLELGTILKIRKYIKSIMEQFESSCEIFLHTLKDEYFLVDIDWVTKK